MLGARMRVFLDQDQNIARHEPRAFPSAMILESFDDLLRAARGQPQPQRLLFVFAGASLPEGASEAQRTRYLAGRGGELAPLMCVDKTPEELRAFAELAEESRQFGQDWAIVFVAALDGRDGRAPTSEEASGPLQRMVESVKAGQVAGFMPFDRDGMPVRFE